MKAPAKTPAAPAQAPVKPKATPTKLAADAPSRFAVQVMTARQMQLAKAELGRLQARGEKAFLVTRDGHTKVCVGPFVSKMNAVEKLTQLKMRYQDCFVRTL